MLLLVGSLFATNYDTVNFENNGVVIQSGDDEYVIPFFNIVGIEKQPKNKIYYMRWYGYYGDSTRTSSLDKVTYEKVKRRLLKVEQ